MSREGSNKTIDLNEVEMVFGSSDSSKSNTKPDVHHITNEKNQSKHDSKPEIRSGQESDAEHPSAPLLEPERGRPKPPLAGPEVDDLDEKPGAAAGAEPYPGIDDGLLEGDAKKHKDTDGETGPEGDATSHEDGVGTDDGKWLHTSHGVDETDFYYGDGFVGNGIHNRFDDRAGSPLPGTIPDVNTYQQKKNLAQGMMDLALLSANANQLRYVLESATTHPYYIPSLVFISCSILLQVAVGVGLIMNSRYNVKDEKDICKADKINNMTVLGIFLITIVNVFITSFSVATPTAPSSPLQNSG